MNKSEVVIIDYGISNILSVQQGFEAIGVNVIVTSNTQVIEKYNSQLHLARSGRTSQGHPGEQLGRGPLQAS